MTTTFPPYIKIAKQIQSCFKEDMIEHLAKTSGFVRRNTSRLTGMNFLLMNVFDTTTCNERSLNDCCDWLEEHFDVHLTKQSLDERYNEGAVKFIKTCFCHVFAKLTESVSKSLVNVPFTVVQLVDSTSFSLPSNLAEHYAGNGGDGGPSFVKIHLNYNLLNGMVQDIFITDGKANDNLYKFGSGEQIQIGGLYIRDLGYYDVEYFYTLDEKGAYFLSRAKSNTVFYIKDDQGKFKRIELEEQLPESGGINQIENLFIGKGKKKVKVRLILESVPQDVVEQRLKKMEAKAKRNKREVSDQSKKMAEFNVFITNANQKDLPTELVRIIYTLRWQIELIFKIWKSVFDLNKVKTMKIERFECYLYSKLIAILLTMHLQNQFKMELWNEQKVELSDIKAAKQVKKNATNNESNTQGS